MNTPEMKDSITVVKGAMVDADSGVVVIAVIATPRAHSAAVPSTMNTSSSRNPSDER